MRWTIAGLLFLSTVINYIDRQTLSVLAPFIKTEYAWTNADFALLIISFRIAYAVGQSLSGRLLDRVGTRNGLTAAVLFYSAAAMLTSTATGLKSFCSFRFLLGLGESANWPGATKAVSEWFPPRQSGWAVALFDSGSSVGAAIAPALVLAVYGWFGSWRPAFLFTGALGFLWVVAFRLLYRPGIAPAQADGPRIPYTALLRFPRTWGIVLSKSLTDPVWFFITDWFAIYLVSKGYRLEESLMAFWIPFLAADAGNFAAGGSSSWLISRGWPVMRARKAVATVSAIGMTAIAGAAIAGSFGWLVTCFAVSTFCYAALSTIILNLLADLYPSTSVASVSGLSGTGAGLGTILATWLTGRVADASSFEPVLIAAGAAPLIALVLLLTLIRNQSSRT